MQDADGDAGGFHALEFGLIQPPADNPQAQLMLENTVDGHIGHLMDPLERFVRVVRHTRYVPHQQDDENEGTRRQFGYRSSIWSKVRSLNQVKPTRLVNGDPRAECAPSNTVRAGEAPITTTMLVVAGAT